MKTVTVKYGIEEVTKQVEDGATVGQVLGVTRAALGFGDNVRALQHGVELPNEAIAPSGGTLVAETRCNAKAQDTKLVTVKYGVEHITKSFDYEATVGEVVDASRVALGYGDNVRALLNGVELPSEAQAPNGVTLTIETRCNAKAS